MDPAVEYSRLIYSPLTNEQYRLIGLVVYRASELDTMLSRVDVHIAARKLTTLAEGEKVYRTLFGKMGALGRLRDHAKDLSGEEATELTRLLDICDPLLTLRNGIVHGSPRQNELGEALMHRKRSPRRGDDSRPMEELHEAVVIDEASLERLSDHLYEAHASAFEAAKHFTPPFFRNPASDIWTDA